MSGFRKFRSTLHRRRRSIEAVELGYLATGSAQDVKMMEDAASSAGDPLLDPETLPLDFSPSAEAMEIGPPPIALSKPKRETDN